MIRIFHENPEFDEYTSFDSDTGRLEKISPEEFESLRKRKDVKSFDDNTPETHTRFPRRIYFQITRNCNLECPTCFIKAGKNKSHVPLDVAKNVAEFMGKNGLIEARLTGGEPTTHPDFFEIMHKFKEMGVYVSVATNGVFGENILERLSREKNLWLICSIDGNRETHNKYRNGSFDLIIKNLKHLKKLNPTMRLRLTTVLTKDNKDQMDELGKICKDLDAESITIIPLRPQVRDEDIKEKMVSAEEFKKVIEDLVKIKEKYGIKVTTTLETDFKNEIYSDPIFRKKSSCAAGREGTNLDYDASRKEFVVYGCSYSPAVDLEANPAIRKPFLAGTFPENDIERFSGIWNDNSNWTIFRDLSLKSNMCKGCGYLGKKCTGSCPIQNINYSVINAGEDILSQLKIQMAKTGEWYCYKKIFR